MFIFPGLQQNVFCTPLPTLTNCISKNASAWFKKIYIETHMDTIPLRVNGREHKDHNNNIKTLTRKGKHGHITTNVMHKCMAHCRIVVWMLLEGDKKNEQT